MAENKNLNWIQVHHKQGQAIVTDTTLADFSDDHLEDDSNNPLYDDRHE